MKPTQAAVSIALAIALLHAPANAQCEGGRWSDAFVAPALLEGAEVLRIKALDLDGPGPAVPTLVFAGSEIYGTGYFEGHPFPTSAVQAWDGRRLLPLSMSNNIAGTTRDLAVFDEDGAGPATPSVFCAGSLTSPSICSLARMRNNAWEPVPGIQASSTTRVLEPFDQDGDGPMPPVLLVGGTIRLSGESISTGVARWDGATWTKLTAGFAPTTVTRLLTAPSIGPIGSPQQLFAAGSRDEAGALVHGVFSWNGESWSQVGAAFSSAPLALAYFDDDGLAGPREARLFAGGLFATIGGTPIPHLAMWDGTAWTALEDQVSTGPVLDLAEFDVDGSGPMPRRLFAARNTAHNPLLASVIPVTGAAAVSTPACDQVTWVAGQTLTLCPFDPDGPGPLAETLVAGGKLTALIQTTPSVRTYRTSGALLWDGCLWSHLPRQLDGPPTAAPSDTAVRSLAVLRGETPSDPDRLIVSGNFAIAGQAAALRIAVWNGHHFEPLGGEAPTVIRHVAVHDSDKEDPLVQAIIAGGTTQGAVPGSFVPWIARWSGSEWTRLETGFTSSFVEDVVSTGCRLLALGTDFGAQFYRLNVFEWTDAKWTQIGEPLPWYSPRGNAQLIAVPDPNAPSGIRLIINTHDSIVPPGSTPCAFVEWDGSAWNAIEVHPAVCSHDVHMRFGLAISVIPTDSELAASDRGLLYSTMFMNPGSAAPLKITRVAGGASAQFDLAHPVTPNPPHLQPALSVTGMASFDADGRGPRPAEMYVGATDWIRGGAPTLWSYGNGSWNALDALASYATPIAFATFDHDGDGPRPPSLIVGHGGEITGLRLGGGFTNPGFLREWIPNIPATLIESPQSLIVRPGDPASFKVLAVGSDASIDWRKDGAPLPDGALATEHSWIIAIDSASIADRGFYDARITNACAEVISAPAELRVRLLEGDANADTVVDFSDITDALANWGKDYNSATGPGDADSDGSVSMSDITATLKNWLAQE